MPMPMPMPTCWWAAAISPQITTTGQDAWVVAYRLTDPSAIGPNAPAPWAPRTSIDAPDPLSVTACAGGPASDSMSICIPGGHLGRPRRCGGESLDALLADQAGDEATRDESTTTWPARSTSLKPYLLTSMNRAAPTPTRLCVRNPGALLPHLPLQPDDR